MKDTDINILINGDTATIKVFGEIDWGCVQILKEKFREVLELGKNVMIDFSYIEYIDSSGVGELIALSKKLNKKEKSFNVSNMNSRVEEILDLCGFFQVVGIVKNAK